MTALWEQALAEAELAFAGYEPVDVWYVGPHTDHVYATCPALRRADPQPRQGHGRLYPEAGDVCGWCVRVWRSRKPAQTPAEASPTPKENR